MKKNHARAEDMTQCTFSLPKKLLAHIKAEAAKQNRSVANYFQKSFDFVLTQSISCAIL
jgi:hypothetical protein